VGRIAGVTAAETRDRALQGAASAFARLGYDGASITDIASEAGVSSGALYAHFGSKAGLFTATLRAHGATEVERLLALGGPGAGIARMLRDGGVDLVRRRPEEGSLLVEAIAAAKRHPDVAAELIAAFTQREQRFAELIDAGQRAGAVDAGLRPGAVSRFVLMLALGSLLVAAMGLPAVDEDDWGALIGDLIGRFDPDEHPEPERPRRPRRSEPT
jgi:AcrR family transcriptional regulator